jgi:Limiting CO2-inducible proteins B/C beta carbonyic anhydrases
VLTCGVTGIGAGLSHAPIDDRGRERYVFFAFPHIAVDETGEPAAIFRPGREGKSSACGALLYATQAVQGGLTEDPPGKHDPRDPEGSILVNRLKRQISADGRNPKDVDIVAMTNVRCRSS